MDELAATRRAFGYMGTTGPAPAAQPNQPPPAKPASTANSKEMILGLTTQKPPPRTVPTIIQLGQANQMPNKGGKNRGTS